MPTPSRFTQARRERILELVGSGTSRRHAALAVGIAPSTLSRWLKRGRRTPDGRYGAFLAALLEAEQHPTMRALKAERARRDADPALAWEYLERTGELARRDQDEPPAVIVLRWPWDEDGGEDPA